MRSAILLVLGCLAVVALAGQTQAAVVQLNNAGFETGDLTGWTTNVGSANVSVVNSLFNYWQPTDYNVWQPSLNRYGQYFAVLETTYLSQLVPATLSQTFTANVGDSIAVGAFFKTIDYSPFIDRGYVRIYTATETNLDKYLGQLFYEDVSSVGDFGFTDWVKGEYTFGTSGNFRIVAGVQNGGDFYGISYLGLDVAFTEPIPPLNVVPEPASLAIWGMLGGLGLISARRSRKHVA